MIQRIRDCPLREALVIKQHGKAETTMASIDTHRLRSRRDGDNTKKINKGLSLAQRNLGQAYLVKKSILQIASLPLS